MSRTRNGTLDLRVESPGGYKPKPLGQERNQAMERPLDLYSPDDLVLAAITAQHRLAEKRRQRMEDYEEGTKERENAEALYHRSINAAHDLVLLYKKM